jgi:hypothetical protein
VILRSQRKIKGDIYFINQLVLDYFYRTNDDNNE